MTTIQRQPIAALRLPGGRHLPLAVRPLVMGVLNITPDSFSDGGQWLEPAAALDRALEMISQGADLIDLGAESTRPGGGVYGEGADPVSDEAELERLLPVLEGLRRRTDAALSVDTRKGGVARAALEAGADLINDIAALDDPALAQAVADASCPVILMHSRGRLRTMQQDIHFDDLMADVVADLGAVVERAVDFGIERQQIVLDPGIGFGKTASQNLELLRRLSDLQTLGKPLLVGASRKSFLGQITNTDVDHRLAGSLAAAGWAARAGAAIVRVHDVEETVQYLRVCDAIARAGDDDG